MTELARHDPAPSWVALAPAAKTLAQDIYKTEFVPQALRGNGPAVLACVMAGAELGLGPMTSLQLIDVIQGRPALSPEGQRALVLRAGHRIVPREMSATACTVWGKRTDTGDELTVTFTMDDAERAGLTGKQNWRQYPDSMLLARATAKLCRALFADVASGIGSYVPEELGHDSPVEAAPGVVDVVEIGEPHSGDSTDPWGEAVPAVPLDEQPLDEDVAPAPTPDKVLADPQARISRRQSQELLKRMEALDPADQDRLRMVWSENKWPTHPDGRLRPTLLTESQHLLATQLLATWTPPPDPEPGLDGGEIAEAVELVEQGGLT